MRHGAPVSRYRGPRAGSRQRGLTLIELMIAVVVGMLMTLAILTVLSSYEGRKRSLTAVNDIQQSGNVALYLVDRAVRSAGTGFVQTAAFAFGCPLRVQRDSDALLPVAGGLPAPFEALDPGTADTFRLAPVLVVPGGTTPGDAGVASDALVLMSASGGHGQTPMKVADRFSNTEATLENTVGFRAGDLVLVSDRQPAADGSLRPCMVGQVAAGYAGGATRSLLLGGLYQHDEVGGVALDRDFTLESFVANLGPAPSFQVLGVGDHSTLFSYDLLGLAAPQLQARAEGVYLMYALYGLDTDPGVVGLESWSRPSGDFAPAALGDGSVLSTGRLAQIKALRIGLVMRTVLPEREPVMSDDLRLFEDAGVDNTVTVALDADQRHYRYRVVEALVPLRNNLLVMP